MLEGERTVEIKIQGVQTWGDHLLQVDHATCDEHMSRPFACTVGLASDEGDDVARQLPAMIGRHAILRVEVVGDLYRYFSGIITRFSQTGVADQRTLFSMEMVPWLWLLGHRQNRRIFQFETAQDVIARVAKEWLDEMADPAFRIDDRAAGPFTRRDYCVQYDETDLEFIERLMEEEGIAYFFVHDDTGHTLVLTDDPAQHKEFALETPVRLALSGTREVDSITDLTLDQDSLPTAHVVSDYHFERPARATTASNESVAPFARPLHEVFTHPGGHAEPFVGRAQEGSKRVGDEMPDLARRLARLRIEGVECEMIRGRGGGLNPLLSAGHLMDVEAEPDAFDTGSTRGYYDRMEGRYLLTSVSHQISGGGHRDATSFAYANTFEALPQKVTSVEELGFLQPLPFRPPRTAEKPRARGPETAVVVGPEEDTSEEIWTDKYGRVLVRFFWDRRDPATEWGSCWLRVAQPWAGKRWGATFIPRIGQEVIVEFLGGDPDRPFVMGSLYNAEQMPPYLGDGPDSDHKDNPRLSGIKTNSTPGGKGFNELRFDDTKGKEQVFIHAQRSMDQRVRGSHRHTVGGSHHVNIGYEDSEGEKHGDLKTKVKGSHHHHVETDQRVRIDGKRSLEVRGDVDQLFWTYLAEAIQDEWTVECPTIVFKATNAICFEVGSSMVVIDSNGVSINGAGASGVTIEGAPTVKINCGTPIVAPMTQHGPPVVEDPEEPAGADIAKSGFVSNAKKSGGDG